MNADPIPIPAATPNLSTLPMPQPASIGSATVALHPSTTSTPTIIYQLRDIHTLDPVPWWPLAPGWWLLISGILLGIWLIWHLFPQLGRKFISSRAWRRDAAYQLRALRWRARRQDTRLSARELSELLRRIAMACYGRDACAGLAGKAWLEWLGTHDPTGYAWTSRGKLLLTAPYAPPELAAADVGQILELIDATYKWLKQSRHQQRKVARTHV